MARGIQAGDKAPDFTLPSQSGDQVRLQDRLGERVVVLYFYPKDNTPGCTAEACAFRDSHETFTDAGAEVIGISSDSADRHAGFADRHKLPFTLLADQGGRVRKAYGVPAVMGLLPGRVTYVIDRTGTVRHVFNSMTNIDGHVTEALEVVRQLQAEQPALPGRLRGLVGQYLAAELRENLGALVDILSPRETGHRPMPRIVRMPTLQELPKGPRRDFVEAVFSLYREAQRPALRDISKEIERSNSAATASPETIRRMLRGTTVPSWRIVNAVVLALCSMANVDPDAGGYDEPPRRELVMYRWNDALDNPEPERVASSGYSARAEPDPWSAGSSAGGYPDDPPF